MEAIKNLKGRDLISITDLSKEELLALLELTDYIKKLSKIGVKNFNYLNGKKIALMFQKHSTRTRSSFSVAIHELGSIPYYFSWNELQIARGETVEDTARVLNKYFDGLILRVYGHDILYSYAKEFDGPVINALSDEEHPCQIIADLYTIYEKFRKLEGIKIGFVGDTANNVATSLTLASALLGLHIRLIGPSKYQPKKEVIEKAMNVARKTNGKIEITEDSNAVEDLDIIYTDVFVSMGMESEKEERLKVFKKYQVNEKMMEKASNAYFMHCGPWHLGEEVTAEVVYSKRSLAFEQAENRLHTSKAILIALF
jgi:ornithine carbamoyltransferase